MTVSAITGITQEGQPQELASFLRAGTVYVMWHSPIGFGQRRLSWKPHNAANFTEVSPSLGRDYRGISALYDPVSDHVVVVWDDGLSLDSATNGSLYLARFNPVNGTLVSGPTLLFQGSNPKLAYRYRAQSNAWVLYYRTAKNKGVYGTITTDGGYTWGSAYPLITGQVGDTSFIDVATYSGAHASVAQVGTDARKLVEASLLLRTRPLASIVKHPTIADTYFIAEPSKFDNTTLTDNLRGALVLSTDQTKLYHLDGVQVGTSDSIGAVARMSVTGTAMSVTASAGPTGNGDDVQEYSLTPALGALSVDLPGSSYAVDLAVSSTHAYVAQYSDASTAGQLVVVDLVSSTTATVLSGLTAVKAVGVANFFATPLVFVATTESGVTRLRVYQQNALSPVLLVNTKLTSVANALSVSPDPDNPTGALIYASLVGRLNIYKYVNSSAPIQLLTTLTLPGGGSFFRSKIASNGNIFVATGNAGLLCLSPDGKILSQIALSGKVVPEWTRVTAYSTGTLVRPREAHQFARSRYYFRATSTGTSGSGEPLWNATDPVVDSGVSWTAVGLVDGVATDLVLDEIAKRVYVVGTAGGNLGTDGRVWLVTARGLL